MKKLALVLTLVAVPAQAEGTWKLVANHLHSSSGGSSHWSRGVRHIREFCLEEKIDHGILTDHDTIGGWFDRAFTEGPGAQLIRGQEWTSNEGHANLVNYSANGPQDVILPNVTGDYDGVARSLPHHPSDGFRARPETQVAVDHTAMVKAVHARGGLVFINHPALRGYRWPDDTFGADACEVNGTWENPSGANAKAWFARRLMAGQRIGAVGGSDYHYLRPKKGTTKGFFTPDIEKPINLVRVEGEGIPGVIAGFKKRHVQVLASPHAPRCEVSVDTNRDGREDGMAGDMMSVKAGQTVKLTVKVTGGKGQTLTFHDVVSGAGAAYTTAQVPVTSNDFVVSVDRQGSGGQTRCTYVEIGKLQCLTNPVWY